MPCFRLSWKSVRSFLVVTIIVLAMSVVASKPSWAQAPLTATPGNGYVTLNWDDYNGGWDTATLYDSTYPGNELNSPPIGNVGLTGPDTVTGLANGRTYYFIIVFFNEGVTVASNEASATMPSLPPAPANLAATASAGQVALTWSAANTAGSYNVYRSSAATSGFVSIGISSTTSFTDTNPLAGSNYYQVTGVSIYGEGPPSNTASSTAPHPTLSSLSQVSAAAGVPSSVITLTGTGFVPASVAQWNGTALTTGYTSSTSLTATIPAADLAASGTASITVTNVAVYGPTSNALTFTVNAPVPTLSSSSPTSLATGSPDTTVTLTGTNFIANSLAMWNGASIATTYVNATSITAVLPAPDIASSGSGLLTVYNPSPAGGTTAPLTVAINNPVPTLTSVSPNQTIVGSPNTGITLTGTNFLPVSVVKWNGTGIATTYQSGTSLTATVPSGDLTVAGSAQVTVTNPAPQGGTSSSATFTISPLPAPGNFTAVSGNGSVTLSWTASTGAVSYNVYRGMAPGGESATPIATGVTALTYTDNAVTNGTTYYYTAVAANSAALSGQSNEAGAVPFAPPSNLVATPSNAKVTLSWNADAGATSYNVYRGTASGSEGASPLANPTSAAYTDNTAVNGTTYYYTVAAVSKYSLSGNSNEAGATPLAPPAVPTNVVAQPGNSQVMLSWSSSNGAASYNVYRGVTAGGESPTPLATGLTGTGYTDNAVTNGITYYYKMAAVNPVFISGLSNEASTTPIPPPSAPTNLTTQPGDAQVTLQWTAGTGATGYNIYRGTSSGAETSIANGVGGTTFNDTGVTNGVQYFYEVTSVNPVGISAASNEAAATPMGAPSGLVATPGNAKVTLVWNSSVGATSYNVYRGTASGGESATPIAMGLGTASYTDSAVTNGVAYYYKVAAVNSVFTSAVSNEASATPVSPPSVPTGLTAVSGNTWVALQWTASAGATSYNVYRGTTSYGESATPIAVGVTGVAFADTYLTDGVTYYYRIAAFNGSGNSPESAQVYATPIAPPTGLTATPGNAIVTLNWTAGAGATSYSVYRGTTSYGQSATPIATGIVSTTYVNTGLTNGVTYYYRIGAFNAGGTSPQGAQAAATPAPPPAAPNVVATTRSNGSILLTWSGASGVTSYNIYRGTGSGGETLYLTGVTGTSYTNVGLTIGSRYYYQLIAVSAVGQSPRSTEASAVAAITTGGGYHLLALQNAANQVALWSVTNYTVTGGVSLSQTPPSNIKVTGMGDFNGDGKQDLLFQYTSTGSLLIWYLNGNTVIGTAALAVSPGPSWRVVGVGDFNADGKSDVLLENPSTGQLAVWYMNGLQILSSTYSMSVVPAGWKAVGVGDYNGDGYSDIVLENMSNGKIAIWYMNGTTMVGAAYATSTALPNSYVAAVANLTNAVVSPSLIFQQTGMSQILIWNMNNNVVANSGPLSLNLPSGWNILAP